MMSTSRDDRKSEKFSWKKPIYISFTNCYKWKVLISKLEFQLLQKQFNKRVIEPKTGQKVVVLAGKGGLSQTQRSKDLQYIYLNWTPPFSSITRKILVVDHWNLLQYVPNHLCDISIFLTFLMGHLPSTCQAKRFYNAHFNTVANE